MRPRRLNSRLRNPAYEMVPARKTRSNAGPSVGGLLRRFVREEDGTATLEFVIWVPTFAAILLLAADLALSLFTYSRMWDISRETARRVAVGEIAIDQAESIVNGLLPNYGTFEVSVAENDDKNVAVAIQGISVSPFVGTLDLLRSQNMVVVHAARMEGGVTNESTGS